MNAAVDSIIPAVRTRTSHRPWRRYGLGLLALFAFSGAHAEMRCVATVDALMTAIADAQSAPEGSVWEILVHTGTYQLNANFIFEPDGSHDNKDLVMIGGWSGPSGQCNSQSIDPSTTIIRSVASTAQTQGNSFKFRGDNKNYIFRSIRFENFANFEVDDRPCPAYNICPGTYAIEIDHVEFDHGDKISLFVQDAKSLVFRNNRVTNIKSNIAGSDIVDAPVGFVIDNNEDPPQITFNTFADLECGGTPGGVMIQTRQPNLALNHNIFQTTGCTHDVYIDISRSGQSVAPFSNLFLDIGGAYSGNLVSQGNVINFNPLFVDSANGNYRLQNASPAVNAGTTILGALQSGFVVSSIDLDGKNRPFGSRFDIGAYESNVYDFTFAVITVNSADDVDDGVCDGTHCSLREAIILANTQDGSDQQIVFDIPGTCPRVIFLTSPLPDITDALTIDGYTQTGANANDLDFGSDANICVAISPGTTGVARAVRVPTGEPDATRLIARGLAFGNGFYTFSTDAIELRAGSGHRIVGNAFGGYLPPAHNTATIGSLPRAVLVRGTATNVRIGTPAAADRNYLGNLTQNGIVLNDATSTGHRIENNYIGVQPDGLTAQANQADGISASGGANVIIDGNTIAASSYGISLLGADTTKFTLTRNNIGINALGIGNATLSNSVGIAVGLGSGQHVIGAPVTADLQPGKYSNFIDNNDGDGILLAADAIASNSIRGNVIGNNGRSGTGIGIDLGGSQAQLANDSGDGDPGPNLSQNYPVIKGSAPIDATTRNVNAILNTSANQSVRVDFYQSLACDPVKGADATNLVGSANANSGATGIVRVSATIAEAGKSGYITATATTSSGSTSELARCVLEDTIFVDSYDALGI